MSSSGTAAAGLRSQATASGGANQAYLRFARLTAPPLAMFGMAWWEISGASFWRDEAATLSAVRRPLPDAWHFLARTDAVHGLYYLLMFPVVRMLGSSEPDVRLPSALAAAAAAAGVAAIAARLVSEQAGLAAGLMFAVFPVASRYGQQARSYSLVMALAVLASYLLVRALTSVSTGRGRWIAYSVSLAAVGWMNLIGMLIIPAHGVSLYRASRTAAIPDQPGSTGGSKEAVICQRRVIACWLGSAVAAVVLVSPLLVLAWPQRHGTERFLAITSIRAIADVPWRLTGSWEMLPLIAVLAAMTIRPGRARAGLVSLCVPWLAVPPVLLLAAGAVIPVYDSRYILFCVPALALLAGAGLETLARDVAHSHRIMAKPVAGVIAGIVLLGAIGIPSQLSYRAPDGHGDNIHLAAQIVAGHAHKGDAVLYQPPWWRQISAAYPYGFAHLANVAIYRTPAQAGNFTGTQLPISQIRERLLAYHRVWLLEYLTFRPDPALGKQWKTISYWHPSTFVLILYERTVP